MSKPNLIYVFADQLRYFSCGYTGDEKAKTPNIDRFAAESVNFYNAVSGHPVCAAYRASLFTGKYTTSTGMVINEIRMDPTHKCIGHVLTENNYETAYIGKWHLSSNVCGDHELSRNSFTPRGPHRLGFDGFWASYGFHHEYYGKHAYYHKENSRKIYCDKYEPDYQTDMAIDKLAEYSKDDQPFAMFLSLGTPHDPWKAKNVPPEYYDLFKDVSFDYPENYLPKNDPHADKWACLSPYERKQIPEWIRVYYAMVANLDYNIGRLLDAIKANGLDKNSVIVFTSDHGELFGAHGRRAKNIFYEEAVRVPFFMKLPENMISSSSAKCDACLNTVDVMPTLLSLMDLPIPAECEGTDLRDVTINHAIQANPTATLGDGIVLTQHANEPDCALMMCTGPTAIFRDGNEWRAVRDKQYTYAIFKVDGLELLFDHVNDPLQMNNLAGNPDYAHKLKELKDKMAGKMAAIKDTFENNSYYEQNWIEDRVILRSATHNTHVQTR